MKRKNILGLLFSLLASISVLVPVSAWADTQFYFIRHVEVDLDDPDKPLTEEGKQRAKLLAEHMQDTSLTHIYSTHFYRNMETVEHVAKAKGLAIIQVPKLGSDVDFEIIDNRSSGKVAVKPMIKALNSVPDGSVVLVTANSGNLFKIMAGVGVEPGSDEMPCKGKKCFPKKEFDNIWHVTKTADGVTLKKTRY